MNSTQQPPKSSSKVMALGGQIIFDENETSQAYQVISGEVVILRSGQMVDLVQAGELLDASIWNGATAVAWTHCVLQEVQPQLQTEIPLLPFDAIQRQLQQAVTSVN